MKNEMSPMLRHWQMKLQTWKDKTSEIISAKQNHTQIDIYTSLPYRSWGKASNVALGHSNAVYRHYRELLGALGHAPLSSPTQSFLFFLATAALRSSLFAHTAFEFKIVFEAKACIQQRYSCFRREQTVITWDLSSLNPFSSQIKVWLMN